MAEAAKADLTNKTGIKLKEWRSMALQEKNEIIIELKKDC